jgi:hypothetical protein
MAARTCDGPGLLAAFRAGAAHLEAQVDAVNGMNVFPVPDGDTGSNMAATVRAALEEADRATDRSAARIAAAISFGALMGARGNSGVITSQILRGIAEALAGKRRFSGLDLAHALTQGTRTAYGAVSKPVEGTILTVIREAAEAAAVAAETDEAVEPVLAAAVAGAEAAVARTPTLLARLREAGVVDAGGQGLFLLLEGALAHARGAATTKAGSTARATASPPASLPAAQAREAASATATDGEYGYETMFLLRARPDEPLDLAAIRDHLETIGESVLVAGDASAAKVHVHNERPDLVIAYGLGQGSLSRITVENLDNQAADVREDRAAAFAGSPAPDPDASNGSRGPAAAGDAAGTAAARVPLAVVAVASGEGLGRIFAQELGVAAVVRGGQAANPSTGELVAAVESVAADEVVILPNNPNVVLAARQVAAISARPIHVVPTRNAAEGIAAMLRFDPGAAPDALAAAMLRAAREIQTLAVTEAIRDVTLGGRKVRRGQTIVLDPDDGLVAVHRDRLRAILEAVATLEPGFEIVTLFFGEGVELAEAERVARAIGGVAAGAEVEVRHGGQPHYRFLISAE